jgi:hypothetical protein
LFRESLDQIDAKTQEIKPASQETYSDLLELADDLPESSPRFILLSYPLTLVRAEFFALHAISFPWFILPHSSILTRRAIALWPVVCTICPDIFLACQL